ncbi:MAG: glycerol-3-phosphate acyltransferase [Dehalococcoidia bacterium]|nr:glycerol-3-phosphate acyltransferase [Dehalococcoidia bacterium]MSQ17276.1 glycerol-3-phosphate acyltransferase [Dehalococcoidia bacterium]
MDWWLAALAGLAAYLLGSFPSAYIMVKLVNGLDVRRVGTRNVGTLNTYYQVGKWGALVVLLADAGKGALVVLLPAWLGAPHWWVYLTAPLVVVGHNWPVFLGFRGGKGAATVLGVSLALLPSLSLIALVPALLAGLALRNVIIGVMAALLSLNILTIATGQGLGLICLVLVLTALNVVTYTAARWDQVRIALRRRDWRGVFYGSGEQV